MVILSFAMTLSQEAGVSNRWTLKRVKTKDSRFKSQTSTVYSGASIGLADIVRITMRLWVYTRSWKNYRRVN